MPVEVGAIVKVRTDKDNLGVGEVARAVERKPSDGPRTKRWIVKFTLQDGSTEEREFTSRQLELQDRSAGKQTAAGQQEKKAGPSRNQKRKARKKRAQEPFSKQASWLMEAMLKGTTAQETEGTDAANANSENPSAGSDADNSQAPQSSKQPPQPLLSDPKYDSSSSETAAASMKGSISKGSQSKQGPVIALELLSWKGEIEVADTV